MLTILPRNGHEAEYRPWLSLAGGAYRGVGIADCVRSGEDAALWLLDR